MILQQSCIFNIALDESKDSLVELPDKKGAISNYLAEIH